MKQTDRNFAIAPSVEQLRQMMHDEETMQRDTDAALLRLAEAPTRRERLESADIPCDDSGEAEPHDAGCDCDDCVTAAEAQQDDYTEARIHDDN